MNIRSTPFVGSWRIVWMKQWDQGFVDVDMEVPDYFTFEKDGQGEFQFGTVQRNLDGRAIVERIEFSWAGYDEMDDVRGRGWAIIQGEELRGHIFFHLGDAAAFRAVRA